MYPVRTLLLPIFLSLLAMPLFAGEKLVIAGTGDSQSVLRALAERFNQAHPDVEVVIPDSIGSGGGIKGLTKGRFKLARTARPVKTKEQTGTLLEHLFALSPIVFVASTELNGTANLTRQQITDIYSGKLDNWQTLRGPDATLLPVDREPGDSSRSVIEKQIAEFKQLNAVAKIFYNTPEAVAAITSHQNTFGYLPLAMTKGHNLQHFSFEGVAPTPENIRSGSYPFVTRFYLVSDGEPQGVAAQFIDYLKSPDAVSILQTHGLLPSE